MLAILKVLDTGRPVDTRNRALCVVLWRSGLRISEALNLKEYDIDLVGRSIRVRHGKGDKARTVGIDAGAVEVVENWLTVRSSWLLKPPQPSTPVFCTRKGRPIFTSYIRTALPRIAREAGVGRRVHAHIFRHTFAVECVREGIPIPYIQRLLGHSSLATTSTYLESLSPEDALNTARKREWSFRSDNEGEDIA